MLSPLFIYIHGFNSSPSSVKARLLSAYLKTHSELGRCAVPELSHWPLQAIQQLDVLIKAEQGRPVVLVGSSLGGFYSLWLTEKYDNCTAVLVNPAIYPYRLLAEWLGDNQNIYTHEAYTLTRDHLHQLEALAVGELRDPKRYLLLVQTADETLDYQEAVSFTQGAVQFVQTGGLHGFDRFEDLIPSVITFGQGRIDLPEPTPLPASF
jgi:predicted esterase YcpF (UPF0227 family)